MRLEGKVAIILGASAEAGTGWAIAKRFAKEGAKVVVGARREDLLLKLADETGGVAQKCDVSKEEDVQAIVQRTLREYGRVDICVNAAALPYGGTIANTPDADMIAAMEVNYFGSVYVVRNVAAAMENGGSIVLFSSMAVTHTMEWVYPYACSKAAVDCLVRYAALEYGPRGIKVNSILPGAIRSEMAAPLYQVSGMEEAYLREIPLGRIGEPDDFAEAALWLCGESFVTGLNLQVSGGNQLTRFPTTAERPAIDGADPTSGA
ncbi:SDR family oxidoreductase [Sphingobium sp. 3R8]|uniref:SDR family NAD(P)-dependent oxidoreductase n=1 Tax=Sphingobium sp. 3R8 TaxID=2874921 RepID=UPI001CC95A38|nr:SDR family oxidoreductase [Sphingobium sp. 3R8]MBZ9649858.1 SDR family oxidoreductase [Sphingobium sp. 3R8]